MMRVHDDTSSKVLWSGDGPLVLDQETLQTGTGDTIAYFDESLQQWVGREVNAMSNTLTIYGGDA